jgi:hypothetical protein
MLEKSGFSVQKHPDFEIETPSWLFNESELTKDVTYWPGAG